MGIVGFAIIVSMIWRKMITIKQQQKGKIQIVARQHLRNRVSKS
jgi:hypothetical protein